MSLENDNSGKIKVLVADDSAFMRTALGRMIESDSALKLCGSAQSGQEALDKIIALKPDVVTLDVEMPGLNGLETLKRIMKDFPLPVIMVSSLTQEGAETTLEALDLGAFDYLPKQSSFVSLDIVKIQEDLIAKVKAAAESGKRRRMAPKTPPAATRISAVPRSGHHAPAAMVALGTSTGGPKALQEILPMLPADLMVPVVIVQHMPKGFTGPFARRLNALCKIHIREAEQHDSLEAGTVYIAPAGQHLTIARKANTKPTIRLGLTPENSLHMPSVDVMMLSAAETFRSLCMGVILTGMGADGAKGMAAIQKEGGVTVGQDEASCTVYGMPRSCAEMGVVQRVVPLQQVPEQIMQVTNYKRRTGAGG
jgi:two-component system chemotaxis response regulator CheB